jgi:hypothetical protein
VSFRWLGLGTPPSQPFEIYELVNNDPVAIETGRTALAAAAVPEPSAALLMMICTVVGCALRRRRHPLRSCDP